jgi:LysR family transcriptional regulator, benzoate and cis,cis-muconate-responsive activator of ben and cat genes
MDIQQLENFILLAKNRNFRQTAEERFITQPALTRQIQLLENELDASLFTRTTKRVELTKAGEYFEQQVTRILKTLEHSKRRTAQIHKGEAGTIRLAFSSSATQNLMPRILNSIRHQLPNLHADLVDLSNFDMVNAIYHQDLDVAFGPNIIPPEGIESRIIYSENFVLLVPYNHHLTQENFTGLEQVAEENFILPSPAMSMGYLESIMNFCHQFGGFTPKISHHTAYSSTVMRLVEGGFGVAIEPASSLLGHDIKIRAITLDMIPQKANMTMLWLKEREGEFDAFFKCIG